MTLDYHTIVIGSRVFSVGGILLFKNKIKKGYTDNSKKFLLLLKKYTT